MSPQALRPDDMVLVSKRQTKTYYHELDCPWADEASQQLPRFAARRKRKRPAPCCHPAEAER